MTGGGDQPAETRRKLWGWFGPPWPSEVCYDGDRVRDEMRKPFPAGETCLWCDEPFDEAAGDAGQAIPDLDGQVRHTHKECMLRQVLGPIAHLEQRCACYVTDPGTPLPDPPEAGMTYREESRAVWRWLETHSIGTW